MSYQPGAPDILSSLIVATTGPLMSGAKLQKFYEPCKKTKHSPGQPHQNLGNAIIINFFEMAVDYVVFWL